MVVFTCQNCNACLKKKEIESHKFKCSRNLHLTCIDCLKDFQGDEYSTHFTCITEDQKYGDKNFVPSTGVGSVKQTAWMNAIQKILLRNSKPNLRPILNFASCNNSIPRAKKKFINFFLNNKQIKGTYKDLEECYELISTEMKLQEESVEKKDNGNTNNAKGDHVNDKATEKKEKKRKTISETQEENDNSEVHTAEVKLKNKKTKSKDVDHDTTDAYLEEGHADETTSKKKKKKKKKVMNEDEDETSKCDPSELELSHAQSEPDTSYLESGDSAQRVKKKKDKCVPELPSGDNKTENIENESSEFTSELSKMSKKERKKFLKQKKYEAELQSIENYKAEEESKEEEEATEKKKKSKHKKHEETNGHSEVAVERRQTKNSISEPDGKKQRLEDIEAENTVEVKPKKFKWDQMIIQVLQNADDYEMPLKRLSKKVCNEYLQIFGEKESYEDILLKFNKKVVKVPGVRVLKDRAKLVC